MKYQKYYSKYCMSSEQIAVIMKMFRYTSIEEIVEAFDSMPYEEVVKKMEMVNVAVRMYHNA